MKAFLGLLLAMGVVKKPTLESYWNDGEKTWLTHTAAFGQVMTRNRFQAVLRFLHCADNSQAPPHGDAAYDPLYKITPVIELLGDNFTQNFV